MKRRMTLPAVLLAFVSPPSRAGWKDDVGFTELQNRLGGALPTGTGVVVTHTEAPSGSNYMPDTASAEFAGKTIFGMSGASGVSSHATTVGAYYYGLTGSISPGIPLILAYNANHWVGTGLLRTSTALAPLAESSRVENHSWIGTFGNAADDADALRRIDLVVERDGVVVVAGVNNGAGSAVPTLLTSAYNVIAVGLTNGNSSYGPTPIDAPGRVKPDLVAPSGLTSYAAPMVASAAALLAQAVDNAGALSSLPAQQQKSARALLVRTLLMAGATKTEFPDWRRGLATPAADGTVPLDYRYGAGELNINNSHLLLTAGEQEGGTTADVGLTGWDFAGVTGGGARPYFFQIPSFSYASSVSVLTVWNRRITTSEGTPLELTPSLANIDLRLYEADGAAPGALRDQSVSTVDNVEHIWRRHLGAGRYAFEITSDTDWDYAVAWVVKPAPTPPSDLDGDGDVDADDVGFLAGCATGPAVGPPAAGCEGADLDADHDVDLDDFGRLQRCFSGRDTLPVAECLD